jgi:curved DNA-binding protein CbpA
MSGNGVGTLSLLRSAFGRSSTPYTVLRCDDSSTPTELRRTYRTAALQYHPDHLLLRRRRDNDDNNGSEGEAFRCTLKFQAVSAAYHYRVLMDEGRRSHYDRTGEVREDDDDLDGPLPPGKDVNMHFMRGRVKGGSTWEFNSVCTYLHAYVVCLWSVNVGKPRHKSEPTH